MRWKLAVVVLCALPMLVLGQNTAKNSVQTSNQANQEEQFQVRQQNFTSGRQLLVNKGVPFNPDDLLRDDWATRLKPVLDSMPEMQQARYETAPLKGAYLADTVYLPEKVQLSGHTIIVANYIVFEGNNPVIRGNFDLNFFPAKPVVVLGTTLAEALHKKSNFLNAGYKGKPICPPFSPIQDLAKPGTHHITLDVSGPPPQATQPPAQKPRPKLRKTLWNAFEPAVPPQINCSQSCDNNGPTGGTGTPGVSPPQSAIGNPNGGPAAPNGSCAGGQSPNGFFGTPGGTGPPGQNAGDGGPGNVGGNAGNINANVVDGDLNQYTFNANGGQGGLGGPAGTGGEGGDGGAGAPGGSGVSCPGTCTAGIGGMGGPGGTAGPGGKGGNGGQGGSGGNGGTITVSLPWNSPGANTSVAGGGPGMGGQAGEGGSAGIPGNGGAGGAGAKDCHGNQASNGATGSGGASAGSAGPGNPGSNGQSTGQNGTASVSFRPAPPGGGGGGGGGCGSGGGFGSLDGGGGTDGCSPIVIDAEREGFHLTSALTGVTFDISGTGHPVQMGWTDAHYHNAFLALPGSDSLVHTGKELFGNFTPQPPSAHPNGFIALAQYDKPENGGNGDGMIDDRDEIFSHLRLWIDENHDGICQPNELHRLPELGVYSLALNYTESRRTDEWGNQFRYKARVDPGNRKDPRDETPTSDPGRWTYDVFFVVK